jgi:hypothetical protein
VVLLPKRTDKETLDWLLASGKLSPIEATDMQRNHDAVIAGKELDDHQRQRANVLYEEKCKIGGERVWTGRTSRQVKNEELIAKFDAMPRPKRPPGK